MDRNQICELTNMCLIQREDGRVLLQMRHKKDWPGYTLPGGHVEKGEDFRSALVREVEEETGLTVTDPRLCGIMEYKAKEGQDRYLVFLYKATRFTGKLKDSSEGEVGFYRYEDIPEESWAMDMDAILEVLKEGKGTDIVFLKDGKGGWVRKLW